MPARPVAVLDANVLFPFQLRNFLLHLAVEELYDPLWSDEIVGEFLRGLRREGRVSDEQCAHLEGQMRAFFPEAWGWGYDGRADGLALPDDGDRHVIALAAHYEADAIVTCNTRHFPADLLRMVGIEAVEPDAFVGALWAQDWRSVFRAAERHRMSLKRHPLSPAEYLESLRTRAGLPLAVERLAAAGFLERAPAVAVDGAEVPATV